MFIAELASNVCKTPVAMITFVDDDNIWIQSEFGKEGFTSIPSNELFSDWVVKK